MQSLMQSFAEGFGVEFESAVALNETEQSKFPRALAEIDHPDWINLVNRPLSDAPMLEGLHRAEGGLLRVALAVDVPKNRIKQAWFTGDFFVNPRRMVADLEAALRDSPLDDFSRTIDEFFRHYPVEMLRLQAADFSRPIEDALSSLGHESVPTAEGARP